MTNEHKGWTGSMRAARQTEQTVKPPTFTSLANNIPEEMREISDVYMDDVRVAQDRALRDLWLLGSDGMTRDTNFNEKTIIAELTTAYATIFPSGYSNGAIENVTDLAQDHVAALQAIVEARREEEKTKTTSSRSTFSA